MPRSVQHHSCIAVADVSSSLNCIRQITPLDAIFISFVDAKKDSNGMPVGMVEPRTELLKQHVEVALFTRDSVKQQTGNTQIMDWIPIVLVTFKVLVLGTGMCLAIKWHYDRGEKQKEKAKEKRAVLRAAGKVAAVFLLSLLGLLLVTFFLGRKLGLDLTFL